MGWYCTRCGHEAGAAGTCPRDGEHLARVSTHDLHGRMLGEYKILATLGGGSYGSVYRAMHTRSGMLVAIKLLHRPIDDVESQRVITEARAAATIAHPNVAKVYDLAVTADRRPYIVMELLEGKPLSALIHQQLDLATTMSIGTDILTALGAAHARGVIHRDLKPDNIFITKGRALIVDFGLAKLVADPRAPSLTQTGEAIGTPHYMAPEQVRGEEADGRADLYAVGCVLFEVLTGRPPFEGTGTYAIFDAHLHASPPHVSDHRPGIPAAVDAAIHRALAKQPRDRFASAAEMQRALSASQPRPRRWPFAVAGAALLGGGIAIGALLMSSKGSEAALHTTTEAPAAPARTEQPRRTFVVPPPAADEPPLDPKLEETLRLTAETYSTQVWTRSNVVVLRCSFAEELPDATPADLRAYYRRMRGLLDSIVPDWNPAIDCKQPPPAAKKFSMPAPLRDEGKIDASVETVLVALHDQLDTGRMTREHARYMHCAYARQHDDAAAEGRLHRSARSLYRRVEILLEAYHPGSTKARCR